MFKKFLFFLKNPIRLLLAIIVKLPYFSFIRETIDYQNRIDIKFWFKQKILGIGGNKNVYWPVHPTSQVYDWQNIYAGIDSCPGLMKGCYIQGKGGIYIGDYTQIAPNVVIVSANHNFYDTREHLPEKVSIGKYSWIGANAVVLPGVQLGDFTVVGAGSVVTKSFQEGHCIIAGNPAKKIKDLDKSKCNRYIHPQRYFGYLNEKQFEILRIKHPTIPNA